MELYYNPEQMSESEIKETFVARHWMLDELLDIVKKQPRGAGLQHVVLIGPRGMGKTTMLLMLRFGIVESMLGKTWEVVRFPEESYSVTDLADFWMSVIAHLNDAKLQSKLDALKAEYRDPVDLGNLAMAALKDWSKRHRKRIAILVDNIDLMLEQMRDEDDLARLRDVLMNDGTFMLVGAASTFFKEARGYQQPLYNFFKTYDVTALTNDQVDDLLRRRAAADGRTNFEEHLKRNAARIRVLRYFTGGSPRLVLMLYRIVAGSDVVEVTRGLEKLLDEVTPYYKAKIEILPPQQRKILDNLARVSGQTHEGLTPTQLAGETRLPVNQVSSQLKRLSEIGYVSAANIRSKNSYYSLAEPLYAIWHQMRFGRTNRQKLDWLVHFLEGWYSGEEGLEQYGRLAEVIKSLMALGNLAGARDVLDIQECVVEALPSQHRDTAVNRLIRDCLEAGHDARLKEMMTRIDPFVLDGQTLRRLIEGGYLTEDTNAIVLKAQRMAQLMMNHNYDLALRVAERFGAKARTPGACEIARQARVLALLALRRWDDAAKHDPSLDGLLSYSYGPNLARYATLMALQDFGRAEELWPKLADAHEEAAGPLAEATRALLRPTNLEFHQRLLNATPAHDALLPLARAIDYLITRDRDIIEKLSVEVRPIVQEIIADYEKKYPPKARTAR